MRLSSCFTDLGISDASHFVECDGIDEEFKVIKKIYFDKILKEHPDKGGNAVAFRATRAAWQVLRDLYEKGAVKNDTFASYLLGARVNASDSYDSNRGGSDEDFEDNDDDDDDDDLGDLYEKYSANANVPSYEYYAAAAEEEVPGYRVELARSGRSTCVKCKSKIEKGAIRVGSLDKVSGAYGRWAKLDCWRVPAKIQNGLTNPSDEQVSLIDLLSMEEVLLTGVGALDDPSKRSFVRHCANSEHWAGNKKRKRIMMGEDAPPSNASKGKKDNSRPSSVDSAFAKSRSNNAAAGSFAVLVPGVDGALDDEKFLRGKTFVVSGTFPEVGGGDDDAVGVANVKAMVQSFGGKVITRFSKNTNFLLVGKDAVASKFKDANKRSVDIVGLRRLQELLLGRVSFRALKNLPVLTSDAFAGSAYQAAGVPSPSRPGAGASSAEAIKKPPPVPKAKMPSKPRAPQTKPAAGEAAPIREATTAVAASNQAVVTRARPNNSTASAVVHHTGKKAKFSIPRPGVNGATAGTLDGKRFVLTGVFPELGGGAGLSLGKDRAKRVIESFGGRVTSAVSGKTDFLLVGKDPGRSKVGQAEKRCIPLVDLLALQRLLLGRATLTDVASEPPPRITNFSAGYPGQKMLGWR